MADVSGTLTTVTGAIAAIGGLGTAAFGLVDASKALNGGISNCGFGHVDKALAPFSAALAGADSSWRDTLRANWINGMAKEDQKAAAKSLIRLGLSAANAPQLAIAGHVDPDRLAAILTAIETGAALTTQDAEVLGRFNGGIDAAMDGGYERGDQQYRNACRLAAGAVAVALSMWGGALLYIASLTAGHGFNLGAYLTSGDFQLAIIIGLIAVPMAPVAKDLASSLQAAVTAMQAVKP